MAIFVLIGGGFYYIYSTHISPVMAAMCGNQLISREEQPGQPRYDLVVYQRDCGARQASTIMFRF